jgi:putative transposase
MGKYYSLDLRERAVAAYLGGESCRSVGARFCIAPSTVVKWAALLKRQGDLKPGKVGGHRKRALEPHRDFILEQIAETPHLTLEKLAGLLAERGVCISPVGVWYFLKAEGLSFKKKPVRDRATAP